MLTFSFILQTKENLKLPVLQEVNVERFSNVGAISVNTVD
jgi:hypothetical protein